MYQIKINNMKFYAHIGFFPEEKKLGQNLEIDLVVKMVTFAQDDELASTVSYADFYQAIADIVAESRVDLIETLAQTIITEIKALDETKIQTVWVSIRKMAVPIDGIFDSVEIEMEG